MATTMTVSQARAALPDVIAQVLAGEEVTLTRHGRAVAVVVRPDRLRTRRAERALGAADRLREAVERGRSSPLSSAAGVSAERAEELVNEVRATRRAR
ncbi:MAG: type II toxin-antitoxin system Phd/YefM family antitoxin [Actinomycetes bacterium]